MCIELLKQHNSMLLLLITHDITLLGKIYHFAKNTHKNIALLLKDINVFIKISKLSIGRTLLLPASLLAIHYRNINYYLKLSCS